MKLQLEEIDIAKLFLDPENEREHPVENIKDIKNSLKLFGQQTPLTIDENLTILKGNGTLLAAKELGWKKIWVHKTELTEKKAKAYKIADNRSGEKAKWNRDLLSKSLANLKDEFSLDELGFDDSWIKTDIIEGQIGDDEIPKVTETRCKIGDLWILGEHRLLCGDSTDVLQVERMMGGEKADMVFTDPPYGVSYADKNAYLNTIGRGNLIQVRIENDHMQPDQMNEFWFTVLSNAHIATSDKASYYICSPQGGDLMMMMMMSIIRAGWQLKHMLIWVKNNHVLGRCDYNYKHEPILYGWKEKGTHDFVGEGRCKTSVWDFNKPLKNDLHPTMKPIELCEEAILNSSRKDQIVIDPFLGSGSTLIACEKTKRKCYGMEIDPHYCDVILSRWEKFTGKKAELASPA